MKGVILAGDDSDNIFHGNGLIDLLTAVSRKKGATLLGNFISAPEKRSMREAGR